MELSSFIIINTKIVRTASEIANFMNFFIRDITITTKITARITFPSGGRLRRNRKKFCIKANNILFNLIGI
ncbi:MAG: hypothetical protein N2319_12900 [Candidatus Kapabacteria bacterium]|nr:hypothetical protein [Candidatus Kapabacteria bacterium]